MKIQPKFAFLAGAACIAAAPLFAQSQEGIARLTDLHGNVLVSRDTGLAAGSDSTRLVEGVRVITTSNSSVIVQYDNGCRVELKENQRFVVERDKPCALLLAEVESLAQPSIAAAGFEIPPGTIAAAGLVGVGVWRWNQGGPPPPPTPVSPN